MGTWGLIQIVLNIFFALGLFIIIMRISRQPKDDPRLSRGLQLLQAKIAVLEDLSDRTESQVQQMTSLLEQKGREIQNKIQLADRHVHLIRAAMDSSLEVAKIFQDKIPHQEIIERQNTLKYLQAARLAHQGKSVDEISHQIDLPKGEIEFIAKVNRDQLMFSEDQLPDWARETDSSLNLSNESIETTESAAARLKAVNETARLSQLANQQELVENLQQVQREMSEMLKTETVPRDLSEVFSVPKPPTESLARLGEEFRKARTEVETPVFGNAASALSFVELDPEKGVLTRESAPNTMAFLEAEEDGNDPLLDLNAEEIEELKRSLGAAKPVFEAPAPAPVALSAATPAPVDPRAQALAQARVAANELKKPQPKSTVNSQRAAASTQPLVRKVEFPRINVKPTNRIG